MSTIKVRRPLAWIALAGSTLAAAALALPAAPAGDEAKAIRALLERQAEDWNRGDLDAFLGGYWQSPKVVFQSGGERFDGWEAMRDRYRKTYQAEGRAMGRLEFTGLDVEILAPDSAFARGRWGLTMPDGKRPGGLFTLILRRFPEGWRIVHDHTSASAS
jgi:beta-aspartyl-peptidase (threonine type)